MAVLGVTETAGVEPSQLVAGDIHEQKGIILAKGENLDRGAVLGIVTSEQNITHGTVAGGPFQAAETITGGTSGATAVVDEVNTGSLDVSSVSGGPFQAAETITGGTSGATAAVTALLVEQNKYKALAPAATNGTGTPRAILAEDGDASAADLAVQAYFIGQYRLSDLVWPTGITAAQKNAALLSLQDRGILVDSDFV